MIDVRGSVEAHKLVGGGWALYIYIVMGPSIGEMPRPTYRPVARHRDQVNVCGRIDSSMTLACVLLSESETGGDYVMSANLFDILLLHNKS